MDEDKGLPSDTTALEKSIQVPIGEGQLPPTIGLNEIHYTTTVDARAAIVQFDTFVFLAYNPDNQKRILLPLGPNEVKNFFSTERNVIVEDATRPQPERDTVLNILLRHFADDELRLHILIAEPSPYNRQSLVDFDASLHSLDNKLPQTMKRTSKWHWMPKPAKDDPHVKLMVLTAKPPYPVLFGTRTLRLDLTGPSVSR